MRLTFDPRVLRRGESAADEADDVRESQRPIGAGGDGYIVLTPDDCMIVLDDLALPGGAIRLRSRLQRRHNGLKDIQRAIGTDRYPRLRIGIDRSRQQMDGRLRAWTVYAEQDELRIRPSPGVRSDCDLDRQRNCRRDESIQRGNMMDDQV